MTPTPPLPDGAARYLAAVDSRLAGLPRASRRAALEDLSDLLRGGLAPADLGPAEEYAAQLLTGGAQSRVLGVPVELRGATDPAVRARVFDPSDERIVVPRLFGAGWSLNLGALAVRLGLLRPDDLDAEVLGHIPPATLAAGRAVPPALAVLTAALAGVAWTRATRGGSRSRLVPSQWGLSTRPDRWAPPGRTLLPLVALGGGAAWWGTRPAPGPDPDPADALVRRALATGIGATTALAAAVTAAATSRPAAPQPAVALLAVALPAAAGASFVWQVRAGLRALGRAAAFPQPTQENP